MDTLSARMQTIIDRHPHVTSAHVQPAPHAPIQPWHTISPSPQLMVLRVPRVLEASAIHKGDFRQPSFPPGPPPPTAEYAAPPRPVPVHTRFGPRPVLQEIRFPIALTIMVMGLSILLPDLQTCLPGTHMLPPVMLRRPLPSLNTVAVRVTLPVTLDPTQPFWRVPCWWWFQLPHKSSPGSILRFVW